VPWFLCRISNEGKTTKATTEWTVHEGVEITEEEKGRLLDALKALEEDAEQEGRNLVLRSLRRLGRRDAAKADFERAANLAATEADRRFLAKQIEELAEKGSLMPPGGADAR
jgi:predicted type IV restriction endonuclease